MKNTMYKLKYLTETIETKNICIVDALCLIHSTIKIRIDFNSDEEGMSNLINSAKRFANSLGIDPESHYIIRHPKRLVSKRLDTQASTQAFMNMQSFYRMEFELVLGTLITLSIENLKNCISSIQLLFQMFIQPFDKHNISLKNVTIDITIDANPMSQEIINH